MQQWTFFLLEYHRRGLIKWVVIEKPAARKAYVEGKLDERLLELEESVNARFDEFSKDYCVVFE